MSSTFNDLNHLHHPKSEPNENSGVGVGVGVGIAYSPSPSLKLNKYSHVIKKPTSPSSSSSAAVVVAGKPRQPVIIYTQTPRIIHTNPKDFMALVQNLTGMSRSDQDPCGNTTTGRREKSINRSVSDLTVDRKKKRNLCSRSHNNYHRNEIFFNSESSSVITKDKTIGENGQVNFSLPYPAVAIPPPLPPPSSAIYDRAGVNYGTYFSTYPISPPANPAENFLCGNEMFEKLDDPLYFAPNMMNSFSSSASSHWFDGLEFTDF